MDVDTIVEISSMYELAAIENELRKLGFKNDFTSNVICRWLIDGIIVDIMPSSPTILGFSNKWYPEAIQNANTYALDKVVIKLISAPYFVATKIEAFNGRGNQDYLGSHDMEDIITVLDGTKNLLVDVLKANKALKKYYKQTFVAFQKDINFLRAIPGHLAPYKGIAAQRIEKVEDLINQFSNLTI